VRRRASRARERSVLERRRRARRTGDDAADAGGVLERFLSRVLGGPERLLRLLDDALGVDDDDVAALDDGGGRRRLVEDAEARGAAGNGDEGGHGTRRGVRRAKTTTRDGWWTNAKRVRWR